MVEHNVPKINISWGGKQFNRVMVDYQCIYSIKLAALVIGTITLALSTPIYVYYRNEIPIQHRTWTLWLFSAYLCYLGIVLNFVATITSGSFVQDFVAFNCCPVYILAYVHSSAFIQYFGIHIPRPKHNEANQQWLLGDPYTCCCDIPLYVYWKGAEWPSRDQTQFLVGIALILIYLVVYILTAILQTVFLQYLNFL